MRTTLDLLSQQIGKNLTRAAGKVQIIVHLGIQNEISLLQNILDSYVLNKERVMKKL